MIGSGRYVESFIGCMGRFCDSISGACFEFVELIFFAPLSHFLANCVIVDTFGSNNRACRHGLIRALPSRARCSWSWPSARRWLSPILMPASSSVALPLSVTVAFPAWPRLEGAMGRRFQQRWSWPHAVEDIVVAG